MCIVDWSSDVCSSDLSLPYDSVKDITPITVLGTVPLVLAVPAKSPYKTVQELVAAAKKEPNTLNYGTSGNGSALHLAALLLESKADIDMMHVPYKDRKSTRLNSSH